MMGPPRIAGHTDDGIATDGEPYQLTGPAGMPGNTDDGTGPDDELNR